MKTSLLGKKNLAGLDVFRVFALYITGWMQYVRDEFVMSHTSLFVVGFMFISSISSSSSI